MNRPPSLKTRLFALVWLWYHGMTYFFPSSAHAVLGEELSASFGEEVFFGRASGATDDFRGGSLRGLSAHLSIGLPITLPWLGVAPGLYLEKRFSGHPALPSLMGTRDTIADDLFWGLGSSLRFNRWLVQGSVILGGSSNFSTSSPRSNPAILTDQLTLGTPFGIRATVGYQLYQAIFMHGTYSLTSFHSLEYPRSTDPVAPKTVEKPMNPAIQEQTFAIGFSAVY